MNARPEIADGDDVIGMFLNVVPFRVRIPPQSWAGFARTIFEREEAILPFRHYPMAALQARAGTPLFLTAFNYTHFHVLDDVAADKVIAGRGGYARTNVPLMVHILTSSTGAIRSGAVECAADWMSAGDTNRFGELFERMLETIVSTSLVPTLP
jgi:hypothetical protein